MDLYKPRFDTRSAAEWLVEAENFDRMAEQFKENAELSDGFRKLALEARGKSQRTNS
ncbi:MAG TPA: hypothetical protein VGU01_15805 [Sphingomicrobium sp.]|nr:hypothetical protein [Sphingomicrobium sp.]